jgi:tRNA A-37 threonylcarbamoyl transferase component Bud32
MDHPRIRGLSEWRPLARGGFAVVWEARQLTLDRLVAVKVYQRELDEGIRHRFLREAAVGRLSGHPGIVTAHDAGLLSDDRPYLIMELCPGGSLTQWLKPENRPSEQRVREVGVRIADALAALHACGVLHNDVRPANILIDSYGNAGLADFGLAVVAGAEEAADDALRVTSAYAPPEAFAMQPATESGDVYSLAATLYALLAGSPPRGVGAAPIALEQMGEVAQKPIGPLPGVNWHLMGALMTALSDDPAARPTAAGFRDQLANVPARISQPGLHVGAAAEAMPNSHNTGVTVLAADSQRAPGQVAAEAPRWRAKRRVAIPALAAASVTLIASGTAWLISEPASLGVPAALTQSSDPAPSTSTTTSGAGASTGSGSAEQETIELADSAHSAKPFQTVRIQGMYRDRADTFLRVQLWESGQWQAFPLLTKTDQSGQFTAYVELGRPGHYRLRVLDPDSGVKSKSYVIVIKG